MNGLGAFKPKFLGAVGAVANLFPALTTSKKRYRPRWAQGLGKASREYGPFRRLTRLDDLTV